MKLLQLLIVVLAVLTLIKESDSGICYFCQWGDTCRKPNDPVNFGVAIDCDFKKGLACFIKTASILDEENNARGCEAFDNITGCREDYSLGPAISASKCYCKEDYCNQDRAKAGAFRTAFSRVILPASMVFGIILGRLFTF